MILDDLKNDNRGRKTHIYWVGSDIRFGDQADHPHDNTVKPLLDLLEDAVPYDCVMLTKQLESQWGNKPFRFVRDCFGPLPPFPKTAIELKDTSGHRALVMFEAVKVDEPPVIPQYFERETALARDPFKSAKRIAFTAEDEYIELTDAAWMVSGSVLVPIGNKAGNEHWLFCDSFVGWFTDGRGQLLTSLITSDRYAILAGEGTEKDTEDQKFMLEVLSFCSQRINVGAMILNLMACKNVSGETRKVSESLQRARRRRGKPDFTEYKVLKVTLPATSKRGRPQGNGSRESEILIGAEPMPLQTIPGQYRDYRERGLFGKLKGIFYVPAHTRGSAEAGQIRKQYQAKGRAIGGNDGHE